MKKSVLEFWVGLFVLLGVVAIGFLSFRVHYQIYYQT